MNEPFLRIGLYIRRDDPLIEHAVIKVTTFLQLRSLTIFINESIGLLPDIKTISINNFPKYCDLTIAIGGDGTILSVARALAGTNIPIVGINVGRLGFLADLTLNRLEQHLTAILEGKYREDIRFLLQVSVNRKDINNIAMNDIVVHAHQSLKMIEFETYINGNFLNSQRADGLVVATPTGSTAYAMSAGGPILDVDLDAIVLASVSPHTLSNRPLVISAANTIDILISEQNHTTAMVTCDGLPGQIIQPGDVLRIKWHANEIKLLHLEGHDHYSILREKLEWGKKLTW